VIPYLFKYLYARCRHAFGHGSRLLPGLALVAQLALCAQFTAADQLKIRVTDANAHPVVDAILFADADVTADKPLDRRAIATVDQINRTFVPRVSVIRQGQAVLFPNSDNIRHHVYSFSKPKVFQIELYEGVPRHPIDFPVSGVVVLGCNIHDTMIGYLVVAPGDVFAKTDSDGKATVATKNALSGINLWHPALAPDKSVTRHVELPAPGADGYIDIVLPLTAIAEDKKPIDRLRSLRRAN